MIRASFFGEQLYKSIAGSPYEIYSLKQKLEERAKPVEIEINVKQGNRVQKQKVIIA